MKTVRATSSFTLVEVLLLFALVGLLLGVALPNSLRARKNADAHHCRANLEDIQYAIQSWVSTEDIGPEEKVTFEAIRKYLDRGEISCPSGGQYIFSAVRDTPSCTVKGHSLAKEEE
jgi:type II secretory pathway pseudopilin PulG